MSSTIKQAILALKSRIADAYTAISVKGGTLPATQDSANLPAAIESIPAGITPVVKFTGVMPDYFLQRCERIEHSQWDMTGVTSIAVMAANSSSLKYCDLSDWDTSNIQNMSFMFQNCPIVTYIDLSGWDLRNVTSLTNAFNVDPSLVILRVGQGWTKGVSITNTGLNHDGLVQFFNDLPTITTSQTITIGASKQALLSAAELAIATDKGWSIA